MASYKDDIIQGWYVVNAVCLLAHHPPQLRRAPERLENETSKKNIYSEESQNYIKQIICEARENKHFDNSLKLTTIEHP